MRRSTQTPLRRGAVYSTAVDMWSVGCIFWELLTGQHVVTSAGSEEDLLREIRREAWTRCSKAHDLDALALALAQALLCTDPARRISAADGLRHPYLAGACSPDELSAALPGRAGGAHELTAYWGKRDRDMHLRRVAARRELKDADPGLAAGPPR